MNLIKIFSAVAGASMAVGAMAHDYHTVAEPIGRDEMFAQWGVNVAEIQVTSEQIAPGLHAIQGFGGTVVISVGESGVLIVDDQIAELVPQILEKVTELGGESVDFAINTHFHFDHADGNLVLGPQGTWLVSHERAREMLQQERLVDMVQLSSLQKPLPAEALPIITYEEAMRFYFNGEAIDLIHVGPAHTDGDTVVIFRGSNVVHMGDVFNLRTFPFIDAGNGGTLDGMIAFCKRILEEINSETVLIPGHGRIGTHADFVAYVEMLSTIHDRLIASIRSGKSFEEIKAAGITSEWEDTFGNSEAFIDRAYWSLTHR